MSEREKSKNMELIADLHMHTIVSNHAFNTITEMAQKAKELGLYAIAITEHGPAMPDSPHPWYFYGLSTLPHRIEDIWLLKGVEANVCDRNGSLDFSAEDFERNAFDWVIASIHSDIFPGPLTEDEATELWLKVAANPYVDCIGHSESEAFRYDYDVVTKEFAKRHKVVEINANSAVVRPGNEKNMRELALSCKKNGTKIAVDSDAHSIYRIAHFETVLPMLHEIDFPKELIVNADRENLIAVLKEHGKETAHIMEGSTY